MAQLILVLNAGSSSIKFSAFEARDDLPLVMQGKVEEIHTTPRFQAFDARGQAIGRHEWPAGTPLGHDGAVAHLGEFLLSHGDGHHLRAVGHRVVHGGMAFTQPVIATDAVRKELARLSPLAPLHQPHNLAAIEIVANRRPELPQVACFDTAFHRAQPEVAQAFALPASITERGVRRYGFHGLSYEYIASVLPGIDARAAEGRCIVAHLGNGASLCAMQGGRSQASTMGFTAVDGLPMGTRCGNIDPGVILYLIDELGMDARAIETLIYKQSGLLGVSGLSSDMRTLLGSDDARAALAVELFCYRIAREIGSLAAALQGLDALVFTAGIGEHAPQVRERVCTLCGWLGVHLDAKANAQGNARISSAASRVSVRVIPTNEELMIARHTWRMVGGAPGDGHGT